MKRKIAALVMAALLIAIIFTGCASNKSSDLSAIYNGNNSTESQAAPSYDQDVKGEDGYGYDYVTENESIAGRPEGSITTPVHTAYSNDKIIYYAYASVETLKFDDTLVAVDSLIAKYSAFIESSSVTGNDYNSTYYGTGSYRNASFVIRVPKESYEKVSDELSTLGNVTGYNTSAQNITSQFVDTESRLATYEIEESRLLAMLEKADTVTDMITIESRLSEVRYNIESLTSTLNNWQHEVDYSTINLSIYEVKELSPEVEIPRTLGEEIKDALSKTFTGMVKFLKNALVVSIAALPILALPVLIAVVILLIMSARSKKRKKNMPAMQQNINNDQKGPDNFSK